MAVRVMLQMNPSKVQHSSKVFNFNSFFGQVKEDTCYVSDNFLRDMNIAKYVKIYVLLLF